MTAGGGETGKITVSDGTKIHYYLDDFTDPWLECETIVVLHGCGATGKLTYRIVPGLARKYRVLRLDERGVGESDVPPGGYKPSLERFTEDVLNVIDELGLHKVHLFGFHSGGWIGAYFALIYPDRAKSLILCNTPFRAPQNLEDVDKLLRQGEKDIPTAIKKLGFREYAKTPAQSLAMEKNVPPRMKEWHDKERGENPTEVEVARYGWAFSFDCRDYIGKLKLPTLIMTGADAPFCTPEMAVEMQRMIPNAQLAIIPNAGGNIYFFHGDRCAEYILHFLRSIKD